MVGSSPDPTTIVGGYLTAAGESAATFNRTAAVVVDFPSFPSAFGPRVENPVASLPARPEPVEIGQASAANG
jgi:hypothetical protein